MWSLRHSRIYVSPSFAKTFVVCPANVPYFIFRYFLFWLERLLSQNSVWINAKSRYCVSYLALFSWVEETLKTVPDWAKYMERRFYMYHAGIMIHENSLEHGMYEIKMRLSIYSWKWKYVMVDLHIIESVKIV